jgi:phage tail tube protein FII
MGLSTTTKAIAAHSNGVPLVGKTKSFKPPVPEKVTDNVTEGRAIEGTRVKGYKLTPFSFKQEGMTLAIASQFNLQSGDDYSLTFKESVEDDEGKPHTYVHEIIGEVTKAAKEESKVGEEDLWSVEGFPDVYKLTIDGKVVHHVIIKTQKFLVNGKDILETHVNNVQ